MSNILQFFENTVNHYPHKTAIAYEDQKYSFLELEEKAGRLASSISKRCSHNQPVAVIVNRDADTLLLFLSVTYSGNYYIPIDPEMPVSKIRSILDDSKPTLILGNEANRALVESLDCHAIFLTLKDSDISKADYRDVPDDTPLYMVYTSGSTGKPKGVLKSHGSIISFIKAFAETFELDSSEVIGNQNPFFFDASAKDFYLMMYTGATLEVIPSEKFIFPVTLVEYMNERKISYVCWVPTALSLVTQMNTFKKIVPQYLKNVFFVGEVFPLKQLRKWFTTLPGIRYVNLYGSSEIAGICCYYEIRTLPESLDLLPMGKALSNCTVFLMENGRLITEPGQTGEVCVAGRALALGYFHNPEKTAASFTELPLPDGRSARTFKTGDLAQYDDDGNLIFISRKDFQIKHMGRRIELGEIETAADTIPDIQRCCCLYNDRKKRIELFCELTPASATTEKELKSMLKSRLSDYMIPSRIHILKQMPLNANGKINRTLLKEGM